MQHYFVYILRCNDSSYYIGHTDAMEKRLSEHHTKANSSCYTASRLPVELVYVEITSSRYEALAFERQIKGWTRKKKEALIHKNFEKLKLYSKKKFTLASY